MNTFMTWCARRLEDTSVRRRVFVFLAIVGSVLLTRSVLASGGAEGAEAGHGAAITILWIAVLLLFAKIGSLVEKLGQPSVLGELVMGVIVGNLALVGLHTFDPIKSDSIITFLAELGVIILLFQIGLESNIKEMRKVGMRALLVAIVGVVAPFVLGTYVVGPWLMPELTSNAHLFLGAALTATSVGITARVFKDLGKLRIPEAQIVLGAAVFDDVFGLIILAVVSALVTLGAVSFGLVAWIVAKSVLFLVGAIVLGQLAAPFIGKFISRIHTGVGMKFTLALVFCLLFAYAAGLIGLAPIIGAFAAGLVLDPVHFRYFKDPKVVSDVKKVMKDAPTDLQTKVQKAIEPHAHRHIEDLIEPVAYFLVPIFFVVTGMSVNLETLFNPSILGIALVVTLVAIFGKYIAGWFAGDVNKSLVGFGMVPRGEVGLIFAAIGRGLGVVNDELFSVIVIMVIFTTLMTPPILAMMLKRAPKAAKA